MTEKYRPISIICWVVAVIALISILTMLPTWARLWGADWFMSELGRVNTYIFWAVGTAVVLLALAVLSKRLRSNWFDNFVLVLATVSLLVLVDRYVVANWGGIRWVHDVDLHYRHRPNYVGSWSSRENHIIVRFNAYGHHDDEFPVEKENGEIRGVVLGDSIAMGHGVSRRDTYANQLEDMIRKRRTEACATQIINTGVQGYATFQEKVMFEESLAFRPEFASIGFLANDVSEPWVVNRNFDGRGFDYHRVQQASSALLGYILNETGWGILARKLSQPGITPEDARRTEIYDVRRVAFESTTDPHLITAWKIVLDDLSDVYALGRREGIPVVLLNFPFVFQFLDNDANQPREILTAHAASEGVDVIDFVQVFEDLIFDEAEVEQMLRDGRTVAEIRKSARPAIRRYFLDDDHLTPDGHRVVASSLLYYWTTKGVLSRDRMACDR